MSQDTAIDPVTGKKTWSVGTLVYDRRGLTILFILLLIGDLVWSREYRKFDPSDPSTDVYSGRQSQIIWAIPVGYEKDENGQKDKNKEYVMPPVAPVPMIRKSGPQTAFVIDNDDKKYQGRVRIAYPWQSPKDNKRLELYAAQKLAAEGQAKYDAFLAKLAELTNRKIMLQDHVARPDRQRPARLAEHVGGRKTGLSKEARGRD